jgi:hypothetical protein
MKKEIIKSPAGLWYCHHSPVISDPLNQVAIVCIGGSGEWGSYTATDMEAEVSRVVEKNGFAQDAANGEELPFHVISPLAIGKKNASGTMQADHALIASEIANIVKEINVNYRFLGGLSQGGQTSAGFFFQSKTGTELNQKLDSSFKNADVFDGFFMLAGQIPSTPTACAFPKKNVFMAHAIGDTSIGIAQSFTMMKVANDCPDRVDKVYSNYQQKWGSTGAYYVPIEVPINAINKLWVIPGGNHSTSWTETYNWKAPSGTAGYEFRKWVETIALPKAEVQGKISLINGRVFATFEDGTKKELSTL